MQALVPILDKPIVKHQQLIVIKQSIDKHHETVDGAGRRQQH